MTTLASTFLFGRAHLLAALIVIGALLVPTPVHAKGDRVPHREHKHHPPPPPPPPPEEPPANVHLEAAGSIALPGLGQSLAWAPDGRRIAVGGHFRDKITKLRYDTRVADVESLRLVKSFACHFYWTVSQAWVDHPDYGELLADGGSDHAVKV